MNMKTKWGLLAAGSLVVTGALAPAASAGTVADPTPVIEWNQLLQQYASTVGPPFAQTRVYAIVQIAVADAAVAVEGGYAPWFAHVKSSRGASVEAAVAQAAHDTAVALTPAGTAAYDAALQASLAKIPPGRRDQGVAVGKAVAAAVLAWRQFDGFTSANPPNALLPSTLPGIWRPTASGQAVFAELGSVLPFGVLTTTQFLPPPPPQLESTAYADAFNEVKGVGKSNSVSRTAEQRRSALLFANLGDFAGPTNPFRLWSNVARDLAVQKDLSLVETARLFALLTGSIHDGLQTAQTSKFVYRLWRPETAIAQAAVDNNPATDADATWAPLLPTPAYPSHSSNMQCIGTSASRMLANVFGGDAQNFTARWFNAGGGILFERSYSSLQAMSTEEGNSRVWGGIHFRFELDASVESCTQVADYIFENHLQRDR